MKFKLNFQIALLACLMICSIASAQSAEPIKVDLTIHADQPKGTISKNIYGHFAEHLGRCIYEGIWVGENPSIPNTRGIRNDVVAALKNLSIPVLRWPGGCFADEYHWRDGIGPASARPKRINTHWGGVTEPNTFGTHEFMDLCEMLGTDPYVGGNLGSGTVQEMMDWVEYMTSDSPDSTLANERRKNGRDKAWKVPYFAVGNESWGCGGNMVAEDYATVFRQYNTFVKDFSGNKVYKIASGASDANYAWTETLMSKAGKLMNGLSLHYYTLPTGVWNRKGPATGFNETQWQATLARAYRMEEFVTKHGEVMDKYDAQKRVGLIVDEWGTWFDPEPGTNPGFLYQLNTMRDAMVAGITLNIFNQHSDRVKMANLAQTINVLQAVILTDKEKMVLTPTYHVFEMYKVHQDATLIPIELAAPEYRVGTLTVPSVQASASRDAAGKIHLSILNLDPNRTAQVASKLTGIAAKQVSGRILTSPKIGSMNTFDKPDVVKPAPFNGAQVQGDQIMLTLPAKSVVVLEIQ